MTRMTTKNMMATASSIFSVAARSLVISVTMIRNGKFFCEALVFQGFVLCSHNHRFAGVTSEVILFGDSHVHEISTNTDFFEDHHHEVGVRTGPLNLKRLVIEKDCRTILCRQSEYQHC
ncbi:YmaF family protein [Sporolituus thermophilus]|uniref:YmaF family protein n=1 Tax=Sporolituus thermophilus TaxID=608505 RepID=UPI003CCB9121